MTQLRQADVGLAVVEMPDSHEKVVSTFILWPSPSAPTWIVVANAKAGQEAGMAQAHQLRLGMLRGFPDTTPLPKTEPGAGRDSLHGGKKRPSPALLDP
jgi:hypothetical protein